MPNIASCDRKRRLLVRVTCVVAAVSVCVLSYGWVRDAVLRNEGVVLVLDQPHLTISQFDARGVADVTVKMRNITSTSVRIVGASSTCSCVIATDTFPFDLPAGQSHQVSLQAKLTDQLQPNGGVAARIRFFVETPCSPVILTIKTLAGLSASNALRNELDKKSNVELAASDAAEHTSISSAIAPRAVEPTDVIAQLTREIDSTLDKIYAKTLPRELPNWLTMHAALLHGANGYSRCN